MSPTSKDLPPDDVIEAARKLRTWTLGQIRTMAVEDDPNYVWCHPAALLDELTFFLNVFDPEARRGRAATLIDTGRADR